jgi:hypothetical protein
LASERWILNNLDKPKSNVGRRGTHPINALSRGREFEKTGGANSKDHEEVHLASEGPLKRARGERNRARTGYIGPSFSPGTHQTVWIEAVWLKRLCKWCPIKEILSLINMA